MIEEKNDSNDFWIVDKYDAIKGEAYFYHNGSVDIKFGHTWPDHFAGRQWKECEEFLTQAGAEKWLDFQRWSLWERGDDT